MHGARFQSSLWWHTLRKRRSPEEKDPAVGSACRRAEDYRSTRQGATVLGFSKETEHGQTIYEADLTIKGRSEDISMDANGKVVEIEEEVPVDSLSDAVKQGLQDKAGKGKIGKVQSLTKNGRLVAYEAKVTTGTKKSKMQVGPDGKPLAHEE